MSPPIFVERKWGYADGTSTGSVTAAEVRRAPYHSRLSKLATETQELASLDLRDLHSKSWTSKVHVFDVGPSQSGLALSARDSATCSFSREVGEYSTWNLEDFRSRLLKDAEADHGRLWVVEDLTPPIMEILGWTLQLNSACFSRHIESAWGHRKRSINATHAEPIAWPGSTGDRLDLLIRYPRLVGVSHPSALKQVYPEWRDDCLCRASRYTQGRQLHPILDLPEECKVQCVSFDHCTISLLLDASSTQKWKGIVFFPHSEKEWTDGHLHVKKEDFVSPEAGATILKKYKAATDDTDVSKWLTSLDGYKEDSSLGLPINVFHTLWAQALGYWQLHTHQLGLATEMLSARSVDNGLEAQRQLRAVIIQGSAMTSDICDDIQRALDLFSLRITACKGSSQQRPELAAEQGQRQEHEDELLARMRGLHVQFLEVKARLERHLPRLENLTQFSIVKQQQMLAETQLEESRKAIQQADTIKRLTILAFVYIPVQTAAAIFGMNMRELSGNPSVWVFFVTAFSLLVVTLSAAGWHRIVPVLYRWSNHVFGSMQLGTCRLLRKVGIKVREHDGHGDRLSSWQRTPEPSWFQ